MLTEKRNGTEKIFRLPDQCPACQTPVQRSADKAAVRCVNTACPAQVKRRIGHFASRNAMNIDGLGPAVIEQLVESGQIRDIGDLFTLEKANLVQLERVGEKSAENLINEIEGSKAASVEKVLFGLGILHVGENMAELLMDSFQSIDNLASAALADVESIHGIGPRVAESIVNFFHQPSNQELLSRLKAAGLQWWKNLGKPQTTAPTLFAGKTVVLTGALSRMTRPEASERIKTLGGRVTSTVSQKTDFLIAGDSPGSKFDRANQLGVAILTEEEFLEKL